MGGVEDARHGDKSELCGRKLEALKCQVGRYEPDRTAVGNVEGMQFESPGGRLLARPGFWCGGVGGVGPCLQLCLLRPDFDSEPVTVS